MINVVFIVQLTAFWTVYNVILFAFRKNAIGARILNRLSFVGFDFGWIQVRYFTTVFNRPLRRLVSQLRPILWRRWFALGAFFTCIVMIFSTGLLCVLMLNTLYASFVSIPPGDGHSQAVSSSTTKGGLVPLVPGVNLPNSHVVYVLVALFVCAVYHELGHALAALADQVYLNGCGVFVMILYPGAFVDISTDRLHDLPPLHQLRIYCGGVWHNIVMCVACVVFLLALPLLVWSVVFSIDTGVVVISVSENSPLSGSRGLAPGDELTAIANCSVYNSTSWRWCISRLTERPQLGNCKVLPAAIDSENDCCTTSNSSRVNACFYYQFSHNDKRLVCLAAHSAAGSRQFCEINEDCRGSGKLMAVLNEEEQIHSINQPVCVFPRTTEDTRLLPVFRRNRVPLLFYGYPSDLLYFSTVSDYIPKTPLLPASLPTVIDILLRYVLSLSGALVVFNAVPCYGLDGQYILGALLEHFFPTHVFTMSTVSPARFFYSGILMFGTGLLVVNIVLAFSNIF